MLILSERCMIIILFRTSYDHKPYEMECFWGYTILIFPKPKKICLNFALNSAKCNPICPNLFDFARPLLTIRLLLACQTRYHCC